MATDCRPEAPLGKWGNTLHPSTGGAGPSMQHWFSCLSGGGWHTMGASLGPRLDPPTIVAVTLTLTEGSLESAMSCLIAMPHTSISCHAPDPVPQ